MDTTLIDSIWTVVAMTMFIGIGIWAYSGSNRERFEQAARMPLDDDDMPASDAKQEKTNG